MHTMFLRTHTYDFERSYMPKKPSSRKYQLTINNPVDHGFTHDKIRSILQQFPSLEYWCMCDETGEQGTPHTHVYVAFSNSVMFDTMHSRFYGVHIEKANGSHRENRDYVRKEGKWLDDAKHETNHPETFEEWGELPPDKTKSETQAAQILQMVKDGKSNTEIIDSIPTAYSKVTYIDRLRQDLLNERYKDEWRDLDVTYIWGTTGAGKTRSVMEQHGYSQVYRVTNYEHPFDGYKGEDVILFDEFRSSLKLADMLVYLDGYPVKLPCRYADKQACFTKVYIVSNIPLEKQYPNIQQEEPESYAAFCRRIHRRLQMQQDFQPLPDDPDFDPAAIFG